MAEAPDYDERLKQLRERAAATRTSLNRAGRGLHSAADLKGRVQTSIRSNISTWLGSAALAGLVLAKLPARSKKVYVNSKTGATQKKGGGLLVALLGLVFQVARPFLQKFAAEKARQLADKYRPPAGRAEAYSAVPPSAS